MKEVTSRILAKHTDKDVEQMSAPGAKDYGLISEVITSRELSNPSR